MESIFVKQLGLGPMKNFAYLVGGAGDGECAVVDPGWDAAEILAVARQEGRRIAAALLTHGHFDHAGGLKDLLRQGDIPVFAHPDDAKPFFTTIPDLRLLRDGEAASVGGIKLLCLHTPGHTPGSQCLLAGDQLFTGDTLFVDCCGRTDLEGSDPESMHRSLRRLAALPPQTTVWPGHDYGPRPSAALGDILKMNPFLAAATLDEFLRLGA
ncbi:MAG TPA: MBL fold hydrolase [Elusimicrobia bacterium]|nr:MBL fold hydrolase [Elusimicrobiota bacterium]HBT61509.1 MBL fold hydrolase [Elusimicrobiota bacterium]